MTLMSTKIEPAIINIYSNFIFAIENRYLFKHYLIIIFKTPPAWINTQKGQLQAALKAKYLSFAL